MSSETLLGWALFYYEGTEHARSAYFLDLDSIRTVLTAEQQAALDPRVNDAALSKEIAQHEVKTVEIVQISQKADAPEWTRMTLQLRCAQNQVNLAAVARPTETTTSQDWFPVPMSWVRLAFRHACDEQPWRDALNATAYHGICDDHPARGGLSEPCAEAISRSVFGNAICDVPKMMAIGMVCIGPQDPQSIATLAHTNLFPALD